MDVGTLGYSFSMNERTFNKAKEYLEANNIEYDTTRVDDTYLEIDGKYKGTNVDKDLSMILSED